MISSGPRAQPTDHVPEYRYEEYHVCSGTKTEYLMQILIEISGTSYSVEG